MPSGCDANALVSAPVQQSRQHFCIVLSRNTSLFGSLFRVMANACQVLGHLMLAYDRNCSYQSPLSLWSSFYDDRPSIANTC